MSVLLPRHGDMDMGSSDSSSSSMAMFFHGTIGSDTLWFKSWVPSSAGATVGVCIALFIIAVFERWLVAFRRGCDRAWLRGQIGYVFPRSTGAFPDDHPPHVPLTSSSTPTTSPSSTYLATASASASASVDKSLDSNQDEKSASLIRPGRVQQDDDGRPAYSEQDPDPEYDAQASDEPSLAHLPHAVRRNLGRSRHGHGQWTRPHRWAVDVPRGLLQSLQTFVHYLLMLVVMTFNVYWMLSVVIGAGVGEMLYGRFGGGAF